MSYCPKCMRKLTRVFHEPNDELAVFSQKEEIIIGNCCNGTSNYYCEYCDEFFTIGCAEPEQY